MKAAKILIILIVLLVVTSCAYHKISMDSINKIQKGLTKEQCKLMLEPKYPRYEFAVTNDSIDYEIQIYDMIMSTVYTKANSKSLIASTNVQYQFGGFTPPPPPMHDFNNMNHQSVPVDITDPYVFIFHKNGLLYWGLFNEISKCETSEISDLMPEIQRKYDMVYSGE
jgi:hypothetical protein